VTPVELDEIRSRISRALRAVQQVSGEDYVTSYTATGTDFVTHFQAVGVKAPEQLQDDFLNLFVWTWSLKDHIKECFKAYGLRAQDVEEVANGSSALMYVSDIANRAKHGSLRESRSTEFAELVGVGFEIPQDAIDTIAVAGPEVTVRVKDPKLVQIKATVRTRTGQELDALIVLQDAITTWEVKALSRIAA
jgi:hypothetical protein